MEKVGASAKPVRLVVGILMLQQMNGYSDEGAVDEWVENPYWQFFCGFDYLEWKRPIDPSSLT
ncbi:MAG: transposase [Parachlamydiaceae bacterium]